MPVDGINIQWIFRCALPNVCIGVHYLSSAKNGKDGARSRRPQHISLSLFAQDKTNAWSHVRRCLASSGSYLAQEETKNSIIQKDQRKLLHYRKTKESKKSYVKRIQSYSIKQCRSRFKQILLFFRQGSSQSCELSQRYLWNFRRSQGDDLDRANLQRQCQGHEGGANIQQWRQISNWSH